MKLQYRITVWILLLALFCSLLPVTGSVKAAEIRYGMVVNANTLKVFWEKNSNATSYEIQYSTSKNFTKAKTVKVSSKNASVTITLTKWLWPNKASGSLTISSTEISFFPLKGWDG